MYTMVPIFYFRAEMQPFRMFLPGNRGLSDILHGIYTLQDII
jgi:hypothetical protein